MTAEVPKPARWPSRDVSWFLPGARKPFAFSTRIVSDTIGDLARRGLTADEALAHITSDRDARRVIAGFIWAGYGSVTLTSLGVK